MHVKRDFQFTIHVQLKNKTRSLSVIATRKPCEMGSVRQASTKFILNLILPSQEQSYVGKRRYSLARINVRVLELQCKHVWYMRHVASNSSTVYPQWKAKTQWINAREPHLHLSPCPNLFSISSNHAKKKKKKKDKADFTVREIYYSNISKGTGFLLQGTLEPRFNEVPREIGSLYIEVLFHTFNAPK